MNKIFSLVGAFFLLTLKLHAQNIDSFHVYHSGINLDSVYIKGSKSANQILSGFTYIPVNDKCGTIYGVLRFVECYSNQPVTFDTTFVYGFPSLALNITIGYKSILHFTIKLNAHRLAILGNM